MTSTEHYMANMSRPERVDVEALAALEAAATPGPWEAVTGSGPKRRQQQVAMVGVASMRGQGEKGCLAVLAGLNTHRADDADLIAAARNALPALLAELAEARAQVERVEHLADEWQDWRTWEGSAGDRIRAALAVPTPPATEGSEDAPCSTCGTTIRLDQPGALCPEGFPYCDNHFCDRCGDPE